MRIPVVVSVLIATLTVASSEAQSRASGLEASSGIKIDYFSLRRIRAARDEVVRPAAPVADKDHSTLGGWSNYSDR